MYRRLLKQEKQEYRLCNCYIFFSKYPLSCSLLNLAICYAKGPKILLNISETPLEINEFENLPSGIKNTYKSHYSWTKMKIKSIEFTSLVTFTVRIEISS